MINQVLLFNQIQQPVLLLAAITDTSRSHVAELMRSSTLWNVSAVYIFFSSRYSLGIFLTFTPLGRSIHRMPLHPVEKCSRSHRSSFDTSDRTDRSSKCVPWRPSTISRGVAAIFALLVNTLMSDTHKCL